MNSGGPIEATRRRALASATPVVIGLGGWAVTSFAFFVLAGRALGPADYSVVAALLSVVVAAFIPLSAMQVGMARPFAIADERAGGLARRALWRSLVVGLCVVGAVTTGSVFLPTAASDPHGVTLTALTTAAVVAMAPMFLVLGVLQGRGRDWALAAVLVAWGLGRPLGFVLLTPVLDDVTAALAGNLVGGLGGLVLALVLVRTELAADRPDSASWSAFTRTLIGPSVGMTGIAILMNADVVAATLTLAPIDAGHFGAASQLAKAGLVIVPQTFGLITVRRVAHRHHHSIETASMAAITASVSILAGVGGILLAVAAGEQIMRIFGPDFAEGAWMLAPMIAALLPFSLNYALVHHQAARNAATYSHVLFGIGILAIAVFALLGRSVGALLLIDAAAGLAGVLAHELVHARDGESLCHGFVNARRARRRAT